MQRSMKTVASYVPMKQAVLHGREFPHGSDHGAEQLFRKVDNCSVLFTDLHITFCLHRFIVGDPAKEKRGSCWLKDAIPKRADWHTNERTVSGVLGR